MENGIIRHRLEGFSSKEDLRLALEEIKLTYNNRSRTYHAVTTADMECRSA